VCREEDGRILGSMHRGAQCSVWNNHCRRPHHISDSDVSAPTQRTSCGIRRHRNETPARQASTSAWGVGPRGVRLDGCRNSHLVAAPKQRSENRGKNSMKSSLKTATRKSLHEDACQRVAMREAMTSHIPCEDPMLLLSSLESNV